MPTPEFRAPTLPSPIDDALAAMGAQDWAPQASLADQVSALREEIKALREELRPIPSLIVTGQRALDAFERLIEQGRGLQRP